MQSHWSSAIVAVLIPICLFSTQGARKVLGQPLPPPPCGAIALPCGVAGTGIAMPGTVASGRWYGTRLPVSPPLPPLRVLTDEERHIAALLQAVQDLIAIDPRLDGALVLELRLIKREPEPGADLRVFGKLVSSDQGPFFDEVIAQAIAADAWWKDQKNLIIDVKGLPVAPLSAVLADRYYGLGLDSFWARDYVAADLAFMRAVAEAPDMDTLRYWRVLTAIAMNRIDRADLLLRPLIRRHPYGSREASIARELERVQGFFRWTLLDLEERIVLSQLP